MVFYSRLRFITNLLPLIQRASTLRRVVTVAGGGFEGPLDSTDFQARRVPLFELKGHLSSLISLGLEAVARTAPEVSFVHDYPGTVQTGILRGGKGLMVLALRAYIYLLGRWVCVPIDESGERHLYFATSARYPPAIAATENGSGVQLGDGVDVAQGTNGQIGSGVYSIGWDGESASPAVQELLVGLRSKGMVEEIWQHAQSELKRITE